MTLDDYFPCKPEAGPVYSRAHGSELWVLLLEKAFAKMNGSYAQIKGGWAFEAMIDLTGAPFHDLRFDRFYDVCIDCSMNDSTKYPQNLSK
jgi:calpain-15